MKLYFVRVQTHNDDFNVRVSACSKQHAESIIREDYTNIYQIDITDISWTKAK